jgi:hypothetical protein
VPFTRHVETTDSAFSIKLNPRNDYVLSLSFFWFNSRSGIWGAYYSLRTLSRPSSAVNRKLNTFRNLTKKAATVTALLWGQICFRRKPAVILVAPDVRTAVGTSRCIEIQVMNNFPDCECTVSVLTVWVKLDSFIFRCFRKITKSDY